MASGCRVSLYVPQVVRERSPTSVTYLNKLLGVRTVVSKVTAVFFYCQPASPRRRGNFQTQEDFTLLEHPAASRIVETRTG